MSDSIRLPLLDRRALLLMAGAAPLLAACGNIIGPPDASQLYVLRPHATGFAPGPNVAWALAVLAPDASDSLDTTRIAINRSPTTLDYYANAEWPDNLTALVQNALVSGFESSGRIAQVAAESEGLHANYLLQTEIRDFEARYDTPDGAPTAVVRIMAKLVTQKTRVIVGQMLAEQEAPAGANSIDAAVAALNQALAAAVVQIVNWALEAPPPR
jgi:cholesterol transport system auxiliary component